MGKIYEFMGLSVGCIYHGISENDRKKAYHSDITYGTNHEFGFDYLRDNMKFRKEELVMRDFNYAIVDEVDSILIDEARTPLIISGAAESSSDLYYKINSVIPILIEGDFEKDEKQHSVILTESGIEKIEHALKEKGILKGSGLYDLQNISLVHHVNAALKAHKLYTKDVDYIVRDDEVIIIDEFTGRMMDGRRYSEGLHQAIEAKENVTIAEENQTLASITYQNFFRLYPKLSGMAGTAMTEADEFEQIYNLKVIEIPSNVPVARIDLDDKIYLSAQEKYEAVLERIRECQAKGQPVLVGTTSIEKSELLSNLLANAKIKHNVLNARHHEKEAYIVAEAGKSGAVTVATNMAGRGTDIKLGGNLEMQLEIELAKSKSSVDKKELTEKIAKQIQDDQENVKKAGGLYIIGTERHESRRIDNQLRGRSGRQGDAGASEFFISLDDDLMRIFAGTERLKSTLKMLGTKEGEVISHKMVSKALEKAQIRVEARNFDIRKHLLKYDDVMNDQRKVIYSQRKELIEGDNIKNLVKEIKDDVIEYLIDTYMPENSVDEWDFESLVKQCHSIFTIGLQMSFQDKTDLDVRRVRIFITETVDQHLQEKENKYGFQVLRDVERVLLLRVLDQHWKDHLLNLDNLRQGINLRAYAQSNPLNEYKHEAFNMFRNMLEKVKIEFMSLLSNFEMSGYNKDDLIPELDFDNFSESDDGYEEVSGFADKKVSETKSRSTPKINRNATCPCGSGKKFKHCHGAVNA
jgi:preprotein translocase subunit SecA